MSVQRKLGSAGRTVPVTCPALNLVLQARTDVNKVALNWHMAMAADLGAPPAPR